MESEESLLRPCKSLPPSFKDLDALQNRATPHPGSVSSTQGEADQAIGGPTKDVIEGASVAQEDGVIGQEDKIASPERGKKPELAAIARRKGPLNLLDLPLDILKDIFKEVSAKGNTLKIACTNSISSSHTRAIYVVLPHRTLPYILLLPLSSTADLI